MKFICDHHKSQAIACPASALRLWSDAFHSGVQAANINQWQEAWRCFGSALDIAVVSYTHNHAHPREQMDKIKMSSENLAIALTQLGRDQEADICLMDLHQRLNKAEQDYKTRLH